MVIRRCQQIFIAAATSSFILLLLLVDFGSSSTFGAAVSAASRGRRGGTSAWVPLVAFAGGFGKSTGAPKAAKKQANKQRKANPRKKRAGFLVRDRDDLVTATNSDRKGEKAAPPSPPDGAK